MKYRFVSRLALVGATVAVLFSSPQHHAYAQSNPVDDTQRLTPTLVLKLQEMQSRFEKKEVGEFDMKHILNIFTAIDEKEAGELKRLTGEFKHNYILRLGLGVHYLFKAEQVRGDADWTSLPVETREKALTHLRNSERELRASMELSRQPYFSIFHLMHISMLSQRPVETHDLYRQADRFFSDTVLVRNRYAISLTPRWGGDYKELVAFIARIRKERGSPSTVNQLVAIYEADFGHTLEEHGQSDEASVHFHRALNLGKDIGGSFTKDYLGVPLRYVCRASRNLAVCP